MLLAFRVRVIGCIITCAERDCRGQCGWGYADLTLCLNAKGRPPPRDRPPVALAFPLPRKGSASDDGSTGIAVQWTRLAGRPPWRPSMTLPTAGLRPIRTLTWA